MRRLALLRRLKCGDAGFVNLDSLDGRIESAL
jgi:hypothetical protein